MLNKKYLRGSEWRKWDLHVHTPYSLINHFPGASEEEKWENYIQDLEALPEDFKVLGINDYLFIEGYRKVLDYKNKGRLKNIDTILCVIEFRVKKFAGHKDFKRVNFHVIFSEDINPQIIQDQFLNALNGKYVLTPGLTPSTWNGLITLESLQDLGKAIKSTIPEGELLKYDSDLKEGFNNLNLDEDFIISLLKENTYLKGKSLTAVGKTEWESLSWNGQSIAEKKDIINKVDFVFISSNSASDWQNAKNKLAEQAVNNLLLDCSDAHYCSSNETQKDRIGKCFTWIKADPTFEGLKQVVYEPETRVLIQDEKPDVKTDYYVIDEVKFTGSMNGTVFSEVPILLNSNLNVIIGGKSSGKSLLLFHIAKTVDPVQVTEKLGIVNEKEYDLKRKDTNFDFNVKWRDGEINRLSDTVDTKSRQITYIPQLYINHLAEQKGEGKLNELINSILEQNEEFKIFIDKQRENISNKNLDISNKINSIFSTIARYNGVIAERKEIGDKTAIEANITQTNLEIENINKTAGFNPEEYSLFQRLLLKKDHQIASQARVESYTSSVLSYLEFIKESKKTALTGLSTYTSFADIEDDKLVKKLLGDTLDDDLRSIESTYNILIDKYIRVCAKLSAISSQKDLKRKALDDQMEPLLLKITNQASLKRLKTRLEDDQIKLKQIAIKDRAIDVLRSELKKEGDALKTHYKELIETYKLIKKEVNKDTLSQIGEDLHLIADLELDVKSFQDGFCGLLDGRSNYNKIFGDCFDTSNKFRYSQESHADHIFSMFSKVMNADLNEIKFKSGYSSKEATNQLFKDSFNIKYNINYKGDDILQMSPGKRGLVLMQIVLHLSNAKHPILIDQPEDNLDNRTIFNDLNAFIKIKKTVRQIILVTHNANLVVSTDAEEVIVANQNGQDKDKVNEIYQFEYASGSLENTFKEESEHSGVLQKIGIREHVCDILEGGEIAFQYRERKYGFK